VADSAKPTVFYDIEMAPNCIIVGILSDAGTTIFTIKDTIEAGDAEELRAIVKGSTLVGFNNLGFDTFLLAAILNGAKAADVYALGKAIIETDAPAWRIAKMTGVASAGSDEIDLLHYAPRAKLKVHEARMGMRRVVTMPFVPGEAITEANYDSVIAYLEHDLEATQRLYREVAVEIETRRELCSMFRMPDLIRRGPAAAAEAVVVGEYARAAGVEFSDVRAGAERQRNGTLTFNVPAWVKAVCAGTVAEELVAAVDGTEFEFTNGRRGDPDRPWPAAIALPSGIEVAFGGVGGIHSIDAAGVVEGGGIDIDVASYYPSLLLAEGGAPAHLDGPIFRKVYRGILERRLEAKAAGHKRAANALKLVLNSTFGKLGEPGSSLFSPAAFLNTTINGQLSLIALGQKSRTESEQ